MVVTRRLKRRVKGNGRNGTKRHVIYEGASKRLRRRGPNKGTPIGSPYKMRVQAKEAREFVHLPAAQEIAAQRLATFWSRVLPAEGLNAVALDHVPQDQPGNFVQLDDLDWSNEGGKQDPELRITIDVVTIYRGQDRAELLGIMHANERALVDAPIVADDVAIAGVSLVGGSASGAGPDGLTYAGLQTFELFAEPA